MLRSTIFAACVLAGAGVGAAAQEQHRQEVGRRTVGEGAPAASHERFVVSSDACGAGRYQHLLGREYARVYQAALLPADTIVQNRHMVRTLEYTPHRLNVVLGGEGRIVAIGCF